MVEGERLGHRERLGDAGGLDHQGVVAAVVGDPAHLLEEVLSQGAADAAVGELDQALLALEDLDPRVPRGDEQLPVEAHLVDEHRDAAALAVGEHVGEEGRLSRAEEAREHGDGEMGHAGKMPLESLQFQIGVEEVPGSARGPSPPAPPVQ